MPTDPHDPPQDPATGVIRIPAGTSPEQERKTIADCLATRSSERCGENTPPATDPNPPPTNDDQPTDRSWTSPCSRIGH